MGNEIFFARSPRSESDSVKSFDCVAFPLPSNPSITINFFMIYPVFHKIYLLIALLDLYELYLPHCI